jgi:hypothetical protein
MNDHTEMIKQYPTGVRIVLVKRPQPCIKLVNEVDVEIELGGDSQIVADISFDIGCAAARLKRFKNGC